MKDDFIALSPLLAMSNDTTLPFSLPAAGMKKSTQVFDADPLVSFAGEAYRETES
jgi:hypothetical protein